MQESIGGLRINRLLSAILVLTCSLTFASLQSAETIYYDTFAVSTHKYFSKLQIYRLAMVNLIRFLKLVRNKSKFKMTINSAGFSGCSCDLTPNGCDHACCCDNDCDK